MEHLKFPIGKFEPKTNYSSEELSDIINTIAQAPARYSAALEGLTEIDLQKVYREGAWNIKRLVHHVSDMHILHLLRLKMAITEPENKNLVIVNINGWAETIDALEGNLADSLTMMTGTHAKMAFLASRLTEDQLNIQVYHSMRQMHLDLRQLLDMTAWHCKHHLAHIYLAIKA
jgi:hypothetical protein